MKLNTMIQGRTGAVLVGATVLVALGGAGGAVAAGQIGSRDIRNGAVHSVDLHNGAVTAPKLAAPVRERMAAHKIRGLESDGPYPGLTQLKSGDNSTKMWTGDSGSTLQSSWVQCAPGKVALGGGFSRADEGDAAFKNLQIVSSRPAQFANGAEVTKPIKGDVDGSILPNAWLVEGFDNAASGTLVVRPWVVCANVK